MLETIEELDYPMRFIFHAMLVKTYTANQIIP